MTQTDLFLFDHHERGRLILQGRDRLALLHRMSTNDVQGLAVGKTALTVLTSPVGRIIDLLRLVHLESGVLVITGEGRGEKIRTYLQRHIFFNDQLTIKDESSTSALLGVYGTGVGAQMSALGYPVVDAVYQADGLCFIRVEPLRGGGLWVYGPAANIEALRARLLENGAQILSPEDYTRLCLQAGLPTTQTELTEDYIPLEAGLWEAVSFNKGCYTGQEIIARMESRGKLAKVLVRVASSSPNPTPSPLKQGDTPVGTLTRLLPDEAGGYLGYAYLKPSALDNKQSPLTSAEGGQFSVIGIVGSQPRPFVAH